MSVVPQAIEGTRTFRAVGTYYLLAQNARLCQALKFDLLETAARIKLARFQKSC